MKLLKSWAFCSTIVAASVLVPAATSFAQNSEHGPERLVFTVQSADALETDTVLSSIANLDLVRSQPVGYSVLANIDTTLNTAYGSGVWETLSSATPGTSLWFAAAGTRSTLSGNSLESGSTDPRRTIYYTRPRSGGNALVFTGSASSTSATFANSGPGVVNSNNANSAINTLSNQLETVGTSANLILPKTSSQVDNVMPSLAGNSFTSLTAAQGRLNPTAFSFGSAGNVLLALDLYRMTPPGNPNGGAIGGEFGPLGTDGNGFFLGSITLKDNGEVGFVTVPEPSTAALAGLGALALAFARRRRPAQL